MSANAACTLTPGPERTVSRVIDGETLQLDDGTRIALANVVAPRAADVGLEAGRLPVETYARQALDATAAGRGVRLYFDEARTDRFGRLRAFVRMGRDADAPWLQVLLARDGHVRAVARHGERGCIDDVISAEAEARANTRGLWNEAAFRVRGALPARDLTAYRGTFQIVEGEVRRVEAARDLTRLILGTNRRRDFSVSIRSNDRAISGPLGGDLKALIGRRIEARGWIDLRAGSINAPDIDVSLAGHVRLLP